MTERSFAAKKAVAFNPQATFNVVKRKGGRGRVPRVRPFIRHKPRGVDTMGHVDVGIFPMVIVRPHLGMFEDRIGFRPLTELDVNQTRGR